MGDTTTRQGAALLALFLAGAVVLSGCGPADAARPDDAGPSASGAQSPSAVPSAPESPSATPSPSAAPAAEPSPVASPMPTRLGQAKDGRNLAACQDGTCEVVVQSNTEIPLAERFGGPIGIGSVDEESVTFVSSSTIMSMSPGGQGSSPVGERRRLVFEPRLVLAGEAIIAFDVVTCGAYEAEFEREHPDAGDAEPGC